MLEMVLRCGKRLKLLDPTSYQMVKRLSLTSIPNFSSPIECSNCLHPKSNPNKQIQELSDSSQTILTPQIVQKTLQKCPSDLVALSFFLWCAKQPNYFHDRLSFQHMSIVVARLTKRFQTVKGIIKELEHIGYGVKPQTLMLLLRIYWCGGEEMYSQVFEAFEQMIHYGYTPNTYARNIVMDVLFKIERIEVALRVLKETEVPNFLSFSIAICNLCKLNDLININDILRIMLRKGYFLNAETYTMVLSCYCKFGRRAEAFQLLGLMTTLGFQISVSIWSMLIDVFCKTGGLDIAGSLLERMVKSGYSPNTVTCTSLIKGYLECKMPDKAFALLNTMESKGYQPDLVLCNVLIHCLSKIGRYDDALDVFFSLQERRLIPDAYTFCAIVSAVCHSRQFLFLPLLLNGLEIQPDLVACNSLISYYCKAGYPSGAVEFYDDMLDRGHAPDKYSFSALLNALCKLGWIDQAVNAYNGILRSHSAVDGHIHSVIMDGLIKSGNSHRAIRILKEAVAQKFLLDIVSYTLAIKALLRNGETGEAYNLFLQMKEGGIAPTIQTYNLMLSGFCKCRDVKMIKQILQEMIDAGIKLDFASVNSMKNMLYGSHHSYSVLNLFSKLCESKLLPEEECVVPTNRLNIGVDEGDALEVYEMGVVDRGVSSSDGLYGTACIS